MATYEYQKHGELSPAQTFSTRYLKTLVAVVPLKKTDHGRSQLMNCKWTVYSSLANRTENCRSIATWFCPSAQECWCPLQNSSSLLDHQSCTTDVHEDRTPCVYKGVPTPWSFDCLLKDIRHHALKMITRLFTSKCARLSLAGQLAISRQHCCSDTRACGTCCGTMEIKSYTTVAPNNEFATQ